MKIYHGYKIVLSTFLIRLISMGIFYSLGLYMIPFRLAFDIGTGVSAVFPATVGSVSFSVAFISGALQDYLTRRDLPIWPIFALGGIAVGAGMIGGSYCRHFWHLLVCSAVTGIGIGWTGWSVSSVTVQWFFKRKGTALSLALTGGGTGSFLYAICTAHLMNAFHTDNEACSLDAADPNACDGWRGAMRYTGIFSAVVLVGASFFLRVPKPMEVENYEDETRQRKRIAKRLTTMATASSGNLQNSSTDHVILPAKDHSGLEDTTESYPSDFPKQVPETLGHDSLSVLTTLGTNTLIDEVLNDLKGEADGRVGAATIEHAETGDSLGRQSHAASTSIFRGSLSLKKTAATRTFVMMMFWASICTVAYDTVFLFIPYFAEDAGLSANDGILALSLTGLFTLTGNLTLGHFSDKFGHTRTLQATMTCCMLCIVVWPFCTSPGSLFVIVGLYGYFSAGLPMCAAVLSVNYEKVAPEHISTMIGIVHTMYAPGSFLGPVVIGLLVDSFQFYVGAFFLAGIFLLGNLFLFFIPARPAAQVEAINKRYSSYDLDTKPEAS
jgi:MFS family permease